MNMTSYCLISYHLLMTSIPQYLSNTMTMTNATTIILGDFSIHVDDSSTTLASHSVNLFNNNVLPTQPHQDLNINKNCTTFEISASNITLADHNLLSFQHTLVLPFQNFYDLVGITNSWTPPLFWVFFYSALFPSYLHQGNVN